MCAFIRRCVYECFVWCARENVSTVVLLVYVGLRLCIKFSVGVRDTECLCAATGTFVYAVNASGLVRHHSNSHSGDVREGNL